jgi:hypothetical protein
LVVVSIEQKAWVRSKAWMCRVACVFWKIKASSVNDANQDKPAAH